MSNQSHIVTTDWSPLPVTAFQNSHSNSSNDDSTNAKTFQLFGCSSPKSPNNKPPASPLPTQQHLDASAPVFVPCSANAYVFDPFGNQQQQQQQQDDQEVDEDLSGYLLSTQLLDDFDDDPEKKKLSASRPAENVSFDSNISSPWSTAWYSSPSPIINSSVKNIWENDQGQKKSGAGWDPYSQVDEKEFDPTLQYYHGALLDSETIQDMNRLSLSVTNPSAEEAQAENVGEDMSALQMLESIFTDLSSSELAKALEEHDYDLDRAIEALINRKMNKSTPPKDTTTTKNEAPPRKRQVCRHFLAGECYRKDCWFAHDLQEKVCKFWLQGSCLKGDFCEFSHHIDVQEVASKIVQKPQSSAPVVKFDEKEYPDLGSSSQKQKPSSFSYYANPSSIKSEEEFPSLASAAKIRTPTTTQNNTPRINFAEAAKRKAGQQQQQKTINTTNKKNNKSRTMQQLRQPVKIPWLVTGSALNKQYLEQRAKAIEYGMLRNRFFSRATAYYLQGDGAKAKAYSNEAKYYNRLMQEMHTEASRRIFEQRNQHEAFIDLHGLHVDEALDMLEERFEKLKSNNYEGVVYIVTGTGHHSGATGLSKKQSKLKPSVEEYLREGNYVFAETSIVGDNKGGIFAVDLSSCSNKRR